MSAPGVPAGQSARASVVVALFTALSRGTGLVRVLMIAAVLGPTSLGNAYQVTNTLPNLIWYGFLAGSLVSSVLVPVLVSHLDVGDPEGVRTVSRAFLGVVATCAALVAPLAVLGLPLLLELATTGVPGSLSDEQASLARVLVVMTVPQIFLYAVIGTSQAVLHAQRRFALAAAGPSLENLGVLVVLVAVAVRYGGGGSGTDPPTGQLLLLGLGSTLAVGLNAALQWWGAWRAGVALLPSGGWRQREVVVALRRAAHSVASAGLLAAQTLLVMLLASRVAGGAVALQIGLNFYALPIALVTTPIGLALLPDLARAWSRGDEAGFRGTFLQGLMSALFLAVPATVGYLLLAQPLAAVVASGRMDDAVAVAMVAGSLAALCIGLVGQACFFVTAQAAYAAGDTATPLRCMALQAAACLVLSATAVALVHGPAVVPAVAGSYAVATAVGGASLLLRVAGRWPQLRPMAGRSLARTGLAAAGMAVAVQLSTTALGAVTGDGLGTLAASAGIGMVCYLVVARLLRSAELTWWSAGLRRHRGPAVPAQVQP